MVSTLNNKTSPWIFYLIVCVVFSLCSFSVQAQIPNIAQIEQLRNLSSEQKRKIAEELGLQNQAPVVTSRNNTFDPTTDLKIALPEESEETEIEKNRFRPGDSLVLELIRIDDDTALLSEVINALGKNVYQLDEQGYMYAPGVGRVLLAGLLAEEAKLRLEAEPALRNTRVSVFRLPVMSVGVTALKTFGHDLFSANQNTFSPSTDMPVPVGYVVGPGDVLSLLIYGQQNSEYRLLVGRDGRVQIPEIGPVSIAGLNYEQLREELTKRVEERYIGVNISLTLGELRSIQVFVFGDVKRPGSFTLNSMSTMTHALSAAGGINEGGSLRNVQLKRQNRLVGSLDIYELLLKGNSKNDRRVRSGDVVYVPPVGGQVAIHGEVNRPALYELRDENDLTGVLGLAGGLLPSAYRQKVTIERFNSTGNKSLVVVDATNGVSHRVSAGDRIMVKGALDEVIDGISVRGHVRREGMQQWRPGMRLLDAIPAPTEFKLQAEQEYLIIRRVDQQTGLVELIPSNWRAAKFDPVSAENKILAPGDTIQVFSLDSDRADRVKPLISELRMQSSNSRPAGTVTIQGRVRAPGTYPFVIGMRISDLLRAGGGTLDNAYLENIEITRIQRFGGERRTVHLPSNLVGLAPGSEADLELASDDVLTVKEIPLYRELQKVTLTGEIRFPGTYSARRGERLSELLERAGGLTNMAFPNGSVFLRADLKEREQVQIRRLAERIRNEVGTFDDTRAEARRSAETLLQQLENTEPLGRLVIDLSLAILGDEEHDVILEDGDRLVIPQRSQEVTVIGEVQYPTSHIFEQGHNQYSYVQKSGGLTASADAKRIYVIRADGKVVANQGNNWFRRSSYAIEALPGDTIVVPFDADRIGKLSLWSNVSQIVYNIGVAAAAIASF